MRTEKEITQELMNLLFAKAYHPPESLPNNGLILETKINVLKWVLQRKEKTPE
jgi:hypothetical protein